MRLQGKTAIVTGGATGIGHAIAQCFVGAGAETYILDRDQEGIKNLSKVYPPTIGYGQALLCDVSVEAQLESTIQRIISRGSIHILINNAGINPVSSKVTETTEKQWDEVMEQNLKGVFLTSRKVIPHMAPKGSIINIASILGQVGARDCSAYSASKGAIIALTKSMALDYAPKLRVNCICPGAVQTKMFNAYLARTDDPDNERQRIVANIPLERLGTVEDVAHAALFLASDEAAWITGAALVVDGGDSI